MTFNTSLKDEISKNVYSSVDACSELSAFVRCNSKITSKQIINTIENASVARKIYKDIKTVFNISSNITVRNQNRFRVKQIYILTINENIELINKIENKISDITNNYLAKSIYSYTDLKNQIILEVLPYINELTGRRPIILPVIMEVNLSIY